LEVWSQAAVVKMPTQPHRPKSPIKSTKAKVPSRPEKHPEESKKVLRKIMEKKAAAGDATAQAALERDAAHDAVEQLLKGKG